MNVNDFLPNVTAYITQADFSQVPGWKQNSPFTVKPLAQGEYNMNYTVHQYKQTRFARTWVFRVNVGTQIQRDDQILYEYRALTLLQDSGVTPCPFYVDDSREFLDYGVLLMEYLSGGKMDYRRDYKAAAKLFAQTHSVIVPEDNNPLIVESHPLSMTYEECARLLPIYLESDLADPALRDYLNEVLSWAAEARHQERYFVEDPWPCIINTEVNSGNFIANREKGTLHLVDWEKPLYGDPSQDLSHFCAPMTTLWKTDYRMSSEHKHLFIDTYRESITDSHLRDTIAERIRLRDPFNYLRGISWSAMAWVTYQTGEHAIRNEDTFRKVTSYLDLEFQREMFDPYLT
jgi:aminoglycoside phosphotransferase (APT) family kinase protein